MSDLDFESDKDNESVFVFIGSSFDTGWQKRGNEKIQSSLSSVWHFFGVQTGNVTAVRVKQKDCRHVTYPGSRELRVTSKQNGDHVDLASWQRVQPDGTRRAAGVGIDVNSQTVLLNAQAKRTKDIKETQYVVNGIRS